MKVCVVGAGVVGLTTALELKKQFNDIDITILADKFNNETTSDGAAGLSMPYLNFRGPTEAITNKWIQDAFLYYQKLIDENCGVVPITGYQFSNTPDEDFGTSIMRSVSPEYRRATKAEIKQLGLPFECGVYCSTMVIACRKFLPWCTEKLERSGVKINRQVVDDLVPLCSQYDAVFNCSGLGSRHLCNDAEMIPVRGQVVQVHAPWAKQYYIADRNYVIPCGYDGIVTLGGTTDFGSSDTNVNPETVDSIVDKCSQWLPDLKHAPRIRNWVGLRPFRKEVRVELEKVNSCALIHNYGHGGSGVTTAPGTSKYAVELFSSFLKGDFPSKLQLGS